MRVMVVRPGPLYSVADVHNGLVKGLCGLLGGENVADMKYDDLVEFHARARLRRDSGRYYDAFDREGAFHMASRHLLAAVYEFWPDVLILTSGFWIPPQLLATLRKRPHHVVAWFTESPYEDDKQLAMAAAVDTVVLNDPTNLGRFQEVNPRSFYFPHSYDPDIHHPARDAKTIDVAFVGTGFPSRVEFLEQVNWEGLDLRLGGMWAYNGDESPLNRYLITGNPLVCMDNWVTADIYRQARTSFNLYRKETTLGGTADGWAMGPREVELAACRTWFAREPRAEGDHLFPMLPTFTEPAELETQLRWALANPGKAAHAAARARRAIVDRTFDNTARRILGLVEDAPKILAA